MARDSSATPSRQEGTASSVGGTNAVPPSAPLPVTQRGSWRSFALATCFMVVLCNSVSILAFAASIVTSPAENPGLTIKYSGRVVRSVYDALVWGLLGCIAKQHYSIIYAPLVNTRRFSAILWSFFGLLVGFHTANAFNPTNDPAFGDATVLGEIISNLSFLICYVVIPLYLKWSLSRALETHPHLFPQQEKSRVFWMLVAAMTCYYISRTAKISIIAIPFYVATIVIVVVACILSSVMISRGKVYARHFDFNLLLHIRVILRLLGQVLQLEWGKRNSALVIFIFRMLNGVGVVLMDDTMEAVFAAPILWCDLYARLGESLTSTAAALNYTFHVSDAIMYLIPNLILTVLKDAGTSDDLRFFLLHKTCLLSRIPTDSVATLATAMSMERVAPSLPTYRNKADHLAQHVPNGGKVPVIQASAPIEVTDPITSHNDSATNMPQSDTLLSNNPVHNPPPMLHPDFTNRQSVKNNAPNGADGSRSQKGSPKWGSPSSQCPSDLVKNMQSDLRLQVTRTEQTLISRIVSIVVLMNAYLLAIGLGATRSDRINLRPAEQGHLIPILILGGTAVEVLIARWLATKVFRWKIRRLDKWRAWAKQGNNNKAGKERSESVFGLATTPAGGGQMPLKSNAVGTKGIGGLSSTSPVQLWVTRLPQRKDFLALLVMSCTYACTIVMGAWP